MTGLAALEWAFRRSAAVWPGPEIHFYGNPVFRPQPWIGASISGLPTIQDLKFRSQSQLALRLLAEASAVKRVGLAPVNPENS
jgi:hypothetical protein